MSELLTRVRAQLAESEPEVRRRATQDVPLLPPEQACELLLVALADSDWRVRKEAAAVAPRVLPRTSVVFAVARALGEHEDIGLRNAAVEALVAIGPDAVPGAIDALARLEADGRKLVVEVLAGAPTLTGMRALATCLADPDPNVVLAAAEGLGRADLAGDEARELATHELAALIAEGPEALRLTALQSLRSLGVEVPWTLLEPLLHDPILRRAAIAAAGGTTVARAVRALAEACADPSTTHSFEATLALGRSIEAAWGNEHLLDVAAKTLRASKEARARLRVLAQPREDDAAVRGAALLALGLVRDPDDVALIADALADDAVADHAEAALRHFGEAAVEPLLVAGSVGAPSVRGATLSMIPQLASRAPPPLAVVRDALGDVSAEVVGPALKSLALVGGPSDLNAVARHVTSPDPKIAGAAQAALRAIAARHLDAARAAVAGTEPHGDAALAATLALEALLRAGAAVPSDKAFLAAALTHRDAAVRRGAIEALASTGSEDAAAAVTAALADEEAEVANSAIRALGRLGRGEQLALLAATTRDPLRLGCVLRALKDADPERAFAAARPLLRSTEGALAAAAVEVVGAVAVEARVEALMGAADHPDHEVAKLALAQLAHTHDERVLAALARAIEHDAEAIRCHAVELLGNEGGVEAEGLLRTRLETEPSAAVRRAIMSALSMRPKSEGRL